MVQIKLAKLLTERELLVQQRAEIATKISKTDEEAAVQQATQVDVQEELARLSLHLDSGSSQFQPDFDRLDSLGLSAAPPRDQSLGCQLGAAA